MKTCLALNPRRPLNRSEAWGCFTANLALPGSGSLVAGRAIGYAQMTCAVIGMGITLVTGMRFIIWFLGNWARLSDQSQDPFVYLQELWTAAQWPLGGTALFGFAMLWAMATSFQILSASPKKPGLPPQLR
jgi:hypothetical protein